MVDGLNPLHGNGGDLDEFAAQPCWFVLGERFGDLFDQDVTLGQPSGLAGVFAFAARLVGE